VAAEPTLGGTGRAQAEPSTTGREVRHAVGGIIPPGSGRVRPGPPARSSLVMNGGLIVELLR